MSEKIDHDRRRFLGTAAMTLAAAELGLIGSAAARQEKKKPAGITSIRSRTNTSFGALKQIDAGVLNVVSGEPVRPMVLRSSFSMAGPTTFTASSRSLRCWPRPATG